MYGGLTLGDVESMSSKTCSLPDYPPFFGQ
jgi:hypothetical protein